MIVDGKAIAKRLYNDIARDVASLPRVPVLAAVTCQPNFETQKYLALKQRRAAEVGITLRCFELPPTLTTPEVVARISEIAEHADGVVIQLPFPSHIDRETILAAVPVHKDPDGFFSSQHHMGCLPPVAGAIRQIALVHDIDFSGLSVVVLGDGRLVGKPAAQFLRTTGASVHVLTADTFTAAVVQEADVLVTGIGQPHFVTPDMVKDGVIVFDAGTSEDGGLVVGDVHPDVAARASLFTPVPGGIGPITVAILLQNLVSLIRQ